MAVCLSLVSSFVASPSPSGPAKPILAFFWSRFPDFYRALSGDFCNKGEVILREHFENLRECFDNDSGVISIL